jgi:hypothetical protein
VLPLGLTLYNYDADEDSDPGRTIRKDGSGPNESDIRKYQSWQTGPQLLGMSVGGSVVVEFWAAMKDFRTDKIAVIEAYLFDVQGATHTQIGSGTTVFTPITGNWQSAGIGMNMTQTSIAAGHELELMIVVTNSSQDDVWFAYDTLAYPSRIAGY